METINNNPGFQDITENIFMSLDHNCLVNCSKVSIFWKRILENPRFWLKKCASLKALKMTKEQEKEWTQIINFLKNTNLESHLTSYLMKIHRTFENNAASKSPSTPFKMAFKSALQMRALATAIQAKNDDPSQQLKVYLEHVEIMKHLVHIMTDDLNAPFANGWTPIQYAVEYKLTEIVEIIAPLVKCPIALNAPGGPSGLTPIQQAVRLGHTEIVKILAPLVKNPNSSSPKSLGRTPIQEAALKEDIDIVKILVPLSIPNAKPNILWHQVSQISSEKFFSEIEKFNIEKFNLSHTDLFPNCPCSRLTFHY